MPKQDATSISQYYQSKSFWLETCGDSLIPRPSLEESTVVDVAIMGAGFTGLWTAYYLSLQNPSLEIAILEKEIAGFGASGRNGGWCLPGISVSPSVAMERFGKDAAKAMYDGINDSVTEVGSVIEKENLSVDWTNGGSLRLAIGEHNLPILEQSLEVYKKLGIENNYELLNQAETERRIRVHGVKGSILTKNSAVLNPGKLARQLARILETRGVKIYEKSAVIDVKPGSGEELPQLVTDKAHIKARIAIVLAGEAYMSQLKSYRRRTIPMYSQIILTEPLTDSQWKEIGWDNRESIGSTSLAVDYLQRTIDGRILFGGRGTPYPFGSKIKDANDRFEQNFQKIREKVIRWFPILEGITFTHAWGGPLGVTRDWTPNILFDKRTRVASAWGYAGQGVSTTNLAGRILTDLITEKQSDLVELPIVQYQSRNWEIEPFRWLGIRFVQSGIERIAEDSELRGIPPSGRTLIERIFRH